ncbi:winged helix-turn-helix transcriptional regulator [Candidatus Woesebacteria bacterium]|nr:winged helix-turn-helix transcriptional regulator [Candidatus Woesebacteria bacterium]
MSQLQDFMISRVRVKMYELFFTHESEMYYVRQITREINEEINAVRRELERMLGAGIIKSEQRGNRLYYFVNTRYLFFQELQQMVAKTTGLGKKIRKNLRKLGTISYVMLSGRYVQGLAPRQGEVDLLFVGEVVLAELTALVKEEEAQLGREINYAVFSLQEFEFRKTRRDPFIMDVLFGSRVMLVGSDAEFSDRKAPGL